MNRPEFDQYAGSYEKLLKDPIRDRFGGETSAFFHLRKRDLVRTYFRQRGIDTQNLSYLDVGCGKGELMSLLRDDFRRVAGCDPSSGMLDDARGVEKRIQEDAGTIPFEEGEVDFVTAVCVYHHVPPRERLALTREVNRVLKPGGTFAIIEHNPYNPATRLIVSRTPVDSGAILLKRHETQELMQAAGFVLSASRYFLYFPESIYKRTGESVENWLSSLPLGGQYAVFATKNKSVG